MGITYYPPKPVSLNLFKIYMLEKEQLKALFSVTVVLTPMCIFLGRVQACALISGLFCLSLCLSVCLYVIVSLKRGFDSSKQFGNILEPFIAHLIQEKGTPSLIQDDL